MSQINDAGLNLVKSFESCSLTPYQDIKGVWTIGWGHTGPDVTAPITQEQADAFLMHDLGTAEYEIDNRIDAPLNENQFSALVSLVYNCGPAPLVGHLGQYLIAGRYDQAADAFLNWDHVNGQIVHGLTQRRTAERDLFLMPVVTA